MTYLLSDDAKTMSWACWKRMGGCGLSDNVAGRGWAGTREHDNTTLGELQERCVTAGRQLASFGRDHLKLPNWAVEEQRE